MSQEQNNQSSESADQDVKQQAEPDNLSIDQQPDLQEGASLTKKRTHRKSDISAFIMKTYKILDEKRNSDIIEWTDDGNCFIVKNKQRFQNQILPKYFKHRKFSSFVRQLNMYDFHKIRKEKEIPIFKHKFFKMGGVQMLHKIKRKAGDEPMPDIQSINKVESPPEHSQRMCSISKTSFNVQNQIDLLARQNSDLQLSIADLTHQLHNLQMSHDRKKQKLMKIISAMMFFQLKDMENYSVENLRQLQDHFIKDEQPWSFMEYSMYLSNIYSYIKDSIK